MFQGVSVSAARRCCSDWELVILGCGGGGSRRVGGSSRLEADILLCAGGSSSKLNADKRLLCSPLKSSRLEEEESRDPPSKGMSSSAQYARCSGILLVFSLVKLRRGSVIARMLVIRSCRSRDL